MKAAAALWFIWVAVAVASTAGVLLWHLEYFKSPGPQYYRIAVVLFPALAVFAVAYLILLRRWCRRNELLIAAAIFTAAVLFYEPRAAAVNALLFIASCAMGNFAVRRLGLALQPGLERVAAGFACGCGLLIPILFLLGLARLLYPATFLALLLAPLVLLWRDAVGCLRDLRSLHLAWRNEKDLRHPVTGVSVVFGVIASGCTAMVALAPSLSFDALSMHLPIASYYASHHFLAPVPGIDYSYFPQGTELLWALAYSLAGQAGVQMFSALCFGTLLISMFLIARACGVGPAAAAAGTIWVATLPFLHWTGSVVKNDMALAMFQALALYAFLRWLENGQFRWIWLGAFFVAQTFAVKHVALFGAIPLALLYGYAGWRQPRRWRSALAVAAMVVGFGAYWAARTYLLTGNPLYPAKAATSVNSSTAVHSGTSAGGLRRYLRVPWEIVFAGKKTFESPLENPAGIVLFVFLPLILWTARRRWTPPRIACLTFVVVYLAYWVTVLNTVRYAIVPIALLVMLAAAATVRFYDARGGLARASVVGLTIYSLLIATMGLMILEINGPQIAYFARRLDKAGYLRAALRTYPSLEKLHGQAERGARVFGIDNCSRFYAPDPYQFACILCPPEGCSASQITAAETAYGAQYLIVPADQTGLAFTNQIYRDAYFTIYRLP